MRAGRRLYVFFSIFPANVLADGQDDFFQEDGRIFVLQRGRFFKIFLFLRGKEAGVSQECCFLVRVSVLACGCGVQVVGFHQGT